MAYPHTREPWNHIKEWASSLGRIPMIYTFQLKKKKINDSTLPLCKKKGEIRKHMCTCWTLPKRNTGKSAGNEWDTQNGGTEGVWMGKGMGRGVVVLWVFCTGLTFGTLLMFTVPK